MIDKRISVPSENELARTHQSRLATVSEAKLLHLSAQTPVIYMERITVTAEGMPLEFLESVWRSDLYDFEFTLVRKS
ncbi:MAG: UTRA domain-containing protein [Anaerolineae bacterium]|nr:UTRA domain-containing protein [Anaerolineae bacterium]